LDWFANPKKCKKGGKRGVQETAKQQRHTRGESKPHMQNKIAGWRTIRNRNSEILSLENKQFLTPSKKNRSYVAVKGTILKEFGDTLVRVVAPVLSQSNIQGCHV